MWNKIKTELDSYPERLKVARVLIENGLSAKDDKIYLNQIEIPPIRIARVAGVDRRTVNETLCTIHENPELRMIFEEIRPAGHSLKEIAKHLDLGVIEITPASAAIRSILSQLHPSTIQSRLRHTPSHSRRPRTLTRTEVHVDCG